VHSPIPHASQRTTIRVSISAPPDVDAVYEELRAKGV